MVMATTAPLVLCRRLLRVALFRAPSLLRLNTEINYDTEAVTPIAERTVVVTSSFVETRFVTSGHESSVDGAVGEVNPVNIDF